MKQLIVFYSFEGNTKFIADEIQKITGADLLELKVKNDIKSHGFFKYFWGGRQVFMKKTPELIDYNKNFDQYDRIFIGTPVWVATYAPAIRTFLQDNKILGKELVFFACFSGSESQTFQNLKNDLKDNKILGTIGFKEPLKQKEQSIKKLNEFLNNIDVV
jgi:flavodoxin